MTIKSMAIVISVSAFISVGIVSANPETTDEWGGFERGDVVIGMLRTPTPTATSTPTPTSTSTPTQTPTPTPVSKIYSEPEYITMADAAVGGLTREESQMAIWGRKLWSDEVDSVRSGIVSWTINNFESRCVLPDGQASVALEAVRERFPAAVYRYNQSDRMYIKQGWHLHGRNYNYSYFDRLSLPRSVKTLYSFVDDKGDTRWIKTETTMDFQDCSVSDLSYHITGYAPTIWLCSRAYKPDEITDELYERCDGHPYSDVKEGRYQRSIPSLHPDEVLPGDPANITCRVNCE